MCSCRAGSSARVFSGQASHPRALSGIWLDSRVVLEFISSRGSLSKSSSLFRIRLFHLPILHSAPRTQVPRLCRPLLLLSSTFFLFRRASIAGEDGRRYCSAVSSTAGLRSGSWSPLEIIQDPYSQTTNVRQQFRLFPSVIQLTGSLLSC
jgi:hypothetical protein